VDYLRHPLETLRVGSFGAYNMLELAKKKNAVFMQASTSEVYGDPLVNPQAETYWGNVNPIGPRSVYDESKRFAEALTMAYHRAYNLDAKIVRIFNTYGPRMRLNDGRAVPNFIYQALNNKPLTIYGDGKQTRSFCYVSDLIEGIYLLLMSKENGPVNIGNPGEVSMLELADLITKLANSRSKKVFNPLPADDPKVRCPDISKAKKILKWRPKVKIEEGLKKTIDWFKKHPDIKK
jgi:dTDP-glucose 4,6-dehydratase